MALTIFGIVLGSIIGIVGLVATIYFGSRALRQKANAPTEAVKKAVEEAIKPVREELARVAEYLDGLPDATPKIRDPFLDGQILEKEYKYSEAIKHYEACFQAETTASQRAALHILIGNCYARLSELEEAQGHYKEAEATARQAKDNEGRAIALGNIGIIYKTKGELDKALDYLKQSLKIDQEIGRRDGEAADLGNIGTIYATNGELDKALDYFQRSLKIDQEIGLREGEAADLGNIGIIYKTKGELDKALDY